MLLLILIEIIIELKILVLVIKNVNNLISFTFIIIMEFPIIYL